MITRVSISGVGCKEEEKKSKNMTTTNSELRINVNSLKRVDPYIKEILETATHVALYNFNQDSNEWEKTEIEGALFVYSRMGEPYHSFLIMNRLNTKNQVEPVTPGLDLQLQEPFLLYKNNKGSIYGIWFYDADECVRISSMLNKIAKESDGTSRVAPKIKKSIQKKANNVDIFSMLSKAQEDYDSSRTCGGERGGKSPMSNALGELSGALSAMNMAPDVTSKSVMDFFAKAKNTKPPPQTGNVISEGKPLLARLMSHPAAHTVEHIEKQQRSVSPQTTIPPQQSTGMIINSSSCENSIISKLKNKMTSQPNKNSTFNQSSINSTGYSNLLSCSDLNLKVNSETDHQNNSSFLRIQSPTNSYNNSMQCNVIKQHKNTIPNFADAFETAMQKQNNVSNNVSFDTMFQHSSMIMPCEDIVAPPLTPKSTTGSGPALIPPGMFAAPSPATAEPLHRPVEPLTRNQLLQAFNYLLRTDSEFVNKLHEAYVKSFSEILS